MVVDESKLKFYMLMRRTYDIFKDVQVNRMGTVSRERGLPFAVGEGLYSDRLEDIEKDLTKKLDIQLKAVPLYQQWLDGVKGIGPRLAAAWISYIQVTYKTLEELNIKEEELTEVQKTFSVKTKGDKMRYPTIRGIGAFATISKLWKWCGIGVEDGEAPRREHGKKLGSHPKMAALAWMTGQQFRLLKGKDSYYEQLYVKYKEELYAGQYGKAVEDPTQCKRYIPCKERLGKAATRLGRDPKKFPCKKHVDNMAMRKAVKEFIKDLWINWRKIEGLPLTGTYEEDVLGHKHGP